MVKAADLKPDKIFVSGEEVDNFKTVNYKELYTLNISATQLISKLFITPQSAIEVQHKQIDILLKEMELLKEKSLTALEFK